MIPFRPCLLALACCPAALAREAPATWTFEIDGHARTMVEAYHNIDFGLGEIQDDDWIHQRLQALFAISHESGAGLTAELSAGDIWGKKSPLGPPDRDDGDFLQLYLGYELDLPDRPGEKLGLRAGRQTLYYGSGRLLASREGANQRLSHDAVLLYWENDRKTRVDAFIGTPVRTSPGAFDNRSHADEVAFWSLYAVTPFPGSEQSFLDLYYIGLRDNDSLFAPGERELRHTLGTRWWDEVEPWVYNSEAIFQFGSAGDRDILAGALSLGLGYVFREARLRPTLMLRADAISGGDDRGDLHTFNPLFQANNYFNEGGFISPSNLYNLNPLVILHPHPAVTVTLGVNFQWRFSAEDSFYGPPFQELGPAAPAAGSYLGTAYNAAVAWQANDFTEIGVGYTHHEAGPSLKAIGGQDVEYFQAYLRLAF